MPQVEEVDPVWDGTDPGPEAIRAGAVLHALTGAGGGVEFGGVGVVEAVGGQVVEVAVVGEPPVKVANGVDAHDGRGVQSGGIAEDLVVGHAPVGRGVGADGVRLAVRGVSQAYATASVGCEGQGGEASRGQEAQQAVGRGAGGGVGRGESVVAFALGDAREVVIDHHESREEP